MADLFLGQTCTAMMKFISAGSAHTFRLPFDADKVVFNNLTAWTATAGKLPVSVWFKGQTTAAHAFQQQVIDTAAAQSFNFLNTSSNGFTEVITPAGMPTSHANISGITQANPCVVTTSAVHGFQTDQIVRFTNLGSVMPTPHGMGQLDGNRYMITVLSTTTFSLQYVDTGLNVDSTAFTAWVSGGQVTVETHVLSLNNPQVTPYATTPYVPNPFLYNPITYDLTAGSAVMGSASDVFSMEIYKFGDVSDLGTLT